MDVCLEAISRVLDVNSNRPTQRGQPKSNTMRKPHPKQFPLPSRKSNLPREPNSMRESNPTRPRKKSGPARVNAENNAVLDAGGGYFPTQLEESCPIPRESNPARVDIQSKNAFTHRRGLDPKCPPPFSDPVSFADSGIVWFLGTSPVWTPGYEKLDPECLTPGGGKKSKTCARSNAGGVGNNAKILKRLDAREETSAKRSESKSEQVRSPALDPVWSSHLGFVDRWVDNEVAQAVAGDIDWSKTRGSRLSKWTSGN